MNKITNDITINKHSQNGIDRQNVDFDKEKKKKQKTQFLSFFRFN